MNAHRAWLRPALVACFVLAVVCTTPQLTRAQGSPTIGEDLIDVGLAFLPPKSSVEYSALRQIGDIVMQEPMNLANGEIWKIKRSNLPRLREAAGKVGATLLPFGTAVPSSTRLAEVKARLTDLQSKLVDAIGDLASAVEIKVVQATNFDILQFAAPTASEPKSIAKLRLALDNGVEIIATRVSTEVKDDLIVWRGKIDATGEPFNIFLGRGGKVTGELRHEKFKYWIRPLGDGVLAVAKIDESRLPEDHGVTDAQLFSRIEELARGGSPEQKARALRFKDLLGQPTDSAAKLPEPGAGGPATIDIMVTYTPKATKSYGDIEFELIRPAIENTNEAFRNSGISDVSVRLVHVHKTDYDELNGEHFDHVWRMVDRDGYMEELPGLRDKHGADVVILIVDNPNGCGLATRVAPEAEEAYAVVHHECAALTFSIAHELGHILGARHDRIVDKAAPQYHGHGYVDPEKKWRSMMAYKQGCDGCPRFPLWSSPAMTVQGKPAGDLLEDNARVIREQAGRVSRFR